MRDESTEPRLLHRKILSEASHPRHQATSGELSGPNVEAVFRDSGSKREEPGGQRKTLQGPVPGPLNSTLIPYLRGVSGAEAISTPTVQSHAAAPMLHREILREPRLPSPEGTVSANLLAGDAGPTINAPPVQPGSAEMLPDRKVPPEASSPPQESATQESRPTSDDAAVPNDVAPVREGSPEPQFLHRAISARLHYPNYESALHGSQTASGISAERINPRPLAPASSDTPSPDQKTSAGTPVDISQPSDLVLLHGRISSPLPLTSGPSHEDAVPASSLQSSDLLQVVKTPSMQSPRAEPHVLHRTASPETLLADAPHEKTAMELSHIANTGITGARPVANDNVGRRTSDARADIQALASAATERQPDIAPDTMHSPAYLTDPVIGATPIIGGGTPVSDRVPNSHQAVARTAQQALVVLPSLRHTDDLLPARPRPLHYGTRRTAVTTPVQRYPVVGIASASAPAVADHSVPQPGSTGMVHRFDYALPVDGSRRLQRARTPAPVGASNGAIPSGAVPPLFDSAPKPGMSDLEVKQLADKVYGLLVRRLSSEKDRRGISDAI